MAVKLSRRAYTHAKNLIAERRVVLDERDAWSEHQPSAREENAFIAEHGWEEYGRWHLGIDDERRSDTKDHYKFPVRRLPGRAPVRDPECRVARGAALV